MGENAAHRSSSCCNGTWVDEAAIIGVLAGIDRRQTADLGTQEKPTRFLVSRSLQEAAEHITGICEQYSSVIGEPTQQDDPLVSGELHCRVTQSEPDLFESVTFRNSVADFARRRHGNKRGRIIKPKHALILPDQPYAE